MAITELLRPQYLVNSASYCMRARAQLSRNVCERSAIDVEKMADESHMIETMVCGYHVYKESRCAAVGEDKRGGELSRSVRCSSGKIGSNRWSRPKKDIVSILNSLFFVDQNSQTLRF